KITEVKKRDDSVKLFDKSKISAAVQKAMGASGEGSSDDATSIMEKVVKTLDDIKEKNPRYIPSIEDIQNIVEETLMESDFHQAAKSYILYRNKRAEERKRDIFEPRINLKPYEYPELLEYVDAIRHSYWIHTEFKFDGDIQDFKVRLSGPEQDAIRKTMLAISQIEVAVKTFWGNIYNRLPKPEIGSVGATFSESEVRHHDAYSHLLEILGLNREFEKLKDEPVIMERVDYLESVLKYAKTEEKKEYAQSILLFSLFIEHVSLFSQFLIIMAFNKYKNQFKGISNVVEATSKEEQIHGDFGIDVINIIKQENPEWFDEAHDKLIKDMCLKAYESESKIVDWIFEKGEFDFLPKKVIKEFIKNRLNNSLTSIGKSKIFDTDDKLVEETEWFDDEVIATKHVDFFSKRSINYTKKSQSVTSDDLF
ncbi:MAG: ribonucleotide-diphosphate reductase subunit beta, partial [Candidatus Woesearchaeota archaeon]